MRFGETILIGAGDDEEAGEECRRDTRWDAGHGGEVRT
jgi:hypothetical protein